jgi:hypothetical protein
MWLRTMHSLYAFKCKSFRSTRHTVNIWNTTVKLLLNYPVYKKKQQCGGTYRTEVIRDNLWQAGVVSLLATWIMKSCELNYEHNRFMVTVFFPFPDTDGFHDRHFPFIFGPRFTDCLFRTKYLIVFHRPLKMLQCFGPFLPCPIMEISLLVFTAS